jgi:membrane associated rhomboid family serine protease
MSQGLGEVFVDLFQHPFTSIFIFLLIWIWLKKLLDEWDNRFQLVTFGDCFGKHQFYKLYTTTITNGSFLSLFLNITALWNLRILEAYYGSIYLLKMTCLLIAIEAIFSYFFISCLLIYFPPQLQSTVQLLNIHSCSSLVIGLVTFQSVLYALHPEKLILCGYFLFAGFLYIPISIMPLLLTMIYYMFLPNYYNFAHFCGLFSGYLLGFGLSSIVNTEYWTVTFLIDFALLLILSAYQSDFPQSPYFLYRNFQTASRSREPTASNNESDSFVEVLPNERVEALQSMQARQGLIDIERGERTVEMTELNSRPMESVEGGRPSVTSRPSLFGGLRATGSSSATSIASRGSQISSRRDEFDEEAQPLLNVDHTVKATNSMSNRSTTALNSSQSDAPLGDSFLEESVHGEDSSLLGNSSSASMSAVNNPLRRNLGNRSRDTIADR